MRIFIIIPLLLLSACNSFMCEFKSVNDMTEREFELCKADFASTEVYVK